MDIENSPVAKISNDFLEYQYEVLGILGHMNSEHVTEICINSPGEIYLETREGWQRVEVPTLTFERARQFCTAVVNESNTGQRVQGRLEDPAHYRIYVEKSQAVSQPIERSTLQINEERRIEQQQPSMLDREPRRVAM